MPTTKNEMFAEWQALMTPPTPQTVPEPPTTDLVLTLGDTAAAIVNPNVSPDTTAAMVNNPAIAGWQALSTPPNLQIVPGPVTSLPSPSSRAIAVVTDRNVTPDEAAAPATDLVLRPDVPAISPEETALPGETAIVPDYVLENRDRLLAELVASISKAYPKMHPAGFNMIDMETGRVELKFGAGTLELFTSLDVPSTLRKAYKLTVNPQYFPEVKAGQADFSENCFAKVLSFEIRWSHKSESGEVFTGSTGTLRSVDPQAMVGRMDLVFFDKLDKDYNLSSIISRIAMKPATSEPQYGVWLSLADVDYVATLQAINDQPNWDSALLSLFDPELSALPINVELKGNPTVGHSLPLLPAMVAGLDEDQFVVLSNLTKLRDTEERCPWTHTLLAGPAGAGETRTCFSAILAWDSRVLEQGSGEAQYELIDTGNSIILTSRTNQAVHNIFRDVVESFGENGVHIAPGRCLINASPLGDELRLDEDPAFLASTYGQFSSLNFLEHRLRRGTISNKISSEHTQKSVLADLKIVRQARMVGKNPRDWLPRHSLERISRTYTMLLELIEGHQVPVLVASTIARLNSNIVDMAPALVIVDEVCQVADLKLIKLLNVLGDCGRLSLMYLGDPRQLPPFTHLPSKEDVLDREQPHYVALAKYKVHVLLYEKSNRLAQLMDADHHNQQLQRSKGLEARPTLCHTLRTEYRMAPAVFQAALVSFYDDFDINYAEPSAQREQTEQHVYDLVNSMRQGLGLPAKKAPGYNVITHSGGWEREGTSRSSKTEAEIIQRLIEVFEETGGDCAPGLISAYKGQYKLIQSRCQRKVSTIDSFQGSQADIIILSLCDISVFTMDAYRLCTAVTRAKHALFVLMPAKYPTGLGKQINIRARRWLEFSSKQAEPIEAIKARASPATAEPAATSFSRSKGKQPTRHLRQRMRKMTQQTRKPQT